MKTTEAPFVQSYVCLTYDAWLKGWHERNGGNLTYRMTDEDVAAVQENLKPASEWLPIGVEVKNLANEYFLVSGTGRFMRNVILDPAANIGIIKVDEPYGLKVLGDGTLEKKVTVQAQKVTGSAIEKIEKAGGKAEVVE